MTRTTTGRFTYLRLSGILDAFFRPGEFADDLAGAVLIDLSGVRRVQATGAIAWRRFLRAVLARADVAYLIAVPPVLVEEMTCFPDAEERVRIVSLELPYRCPKCAKVTHHLVDVDRHRDELDHGRVPGLACGDCGTAQMSAMRECFVERLAWLPPGRTPSRVRRVIGVAGDTALEPASTTGDAPPRPRGLRSALKVVAAALLTAIALAICLP